MNQIFLYNRDGARLWLDKIEDIDDKYSTWKLNVDGEHSYCLEYLRVIGRPIEAIDPSGGPYIAKGDVFDEGYTVVDFPNCTTLKLKKND